MYVILRIYVCVSECVNWSNQDGLRDPEWFGSHSQHARHQAYGVLIRSTRNELMLIPHSAETAYSQREYAVNDSQTMEDPGDPPNSS